MFEEDKTRIDRDTWVSAVSYPAEVRDDQHDPTYLGDPHPAHLRDGPGFLEAPREPRSLSLYSLTGHYQPLQCISWSFLSEALYPDKMLLVHYQPHYLSQSLFKWPRVQKSNAYDISIMDELIFYYLTTFLGPNYDQDHDDQSSVSPKDDFSVEKPMR